MCPVNLSEIWEWEGPAQGGRYELQLLRDLDMLGADSPWTLDQISVSGQNLTFIINYLWRSPIVVVVSVGLTWLWLVVFADKDVVFKIVQLNTAPLSCEPTNTAS